MTEAEKTRTPILFFMQSPSFLQVGLLSAYVCTMFYKGALRMRKHIIFPALTYLFWLYGLESAIQTEDLSATLSVLLGRNWV